MQCLWHVVDGEPLQRHAGGTVFTGKCAGSTSTSPLGVANHKCPSRVRHAEGWLLVAVSRLRSPSAAPNSIQCEQLAVRIIACPAIAARNPLPVANHRWPRRRRVIAWMVVCK
jgi:hypothetical protein